MTIVKVFVEFLGLSVRGIIMFPTFLSVNVTHLEHTIHVCLWCICAFLKVVYRIDGRGFLPTSPKIEMM